MKRASLLLSLVLAACSGEHDVGTNDQGLGAEGQPPHKNGSCNKGLTNCNGVCRNLQTDAANCGACGQACPQGQKCVLGACQGGCGQGLTQCGNACVDLQTDFLNCGQCGHACQMGEQCTQGNCVRPCNGFLLIECNGICVDPQTDPFNCGACGHACAMGEQCVQGVCVMGNGCGQGLTQCGNACVDLQTDLLNCGQCGHACAMGEQCVQGVCIMGGCGFGRIMCNGVCTDPASDPLNCGACGNACAMGQQCVNGACVQNGCGMGLTQCGNQCVNLQTDVGNCGACGKVCMQVQNGTFGCAAGQCVIGACFAGFANCDQVYANGCEVKVDNNISNCGGCGRGCSNANVVQLICSGGLCNPSCKAGFANCFRPVAPNADDGCETNITANSKHCGACGQACPNGTACVMGQCLQVNCGGVQQACCQGVCRDVLTCVNNICT